MKKIILIALLFVFIGGVTAVAEIEIVDMCMSVCFEEDNEDTDDPEDKVRRCCSEGFSPCKKTIYKSDDNGKTIDKEEVKECCRSVCCHEGSVESPDKKICCSATDVFIVRDLEECLEPEDDQDPDLKRYTRVYGCCGGETYISRYKFLKDEDEGEGEKKEEEGVCATIEGCCATTPKQKAVEAMGCQDCGGQSLPIGGCCGEEEEVYVSGYGDCGAIQACCPLGHKAYYTSCKDPAKGGCCPGDTEHLCADGKDICCPKDKIKDGKCEGCGAGETPYTNETGGSACCAGSVFNCNDKDGDGVTTCECCPKCTGLDKDGRPIPAGCGEVKDE